MMCLAGLAGLEQLFHEGALVDFSLDGRAVEQVKGLREVRFDLDLAGAGGLARGAAEGREKERAGIAVRDLDGVRAAREAGELVLRLGDLREAIQEHLGRTRRIAAWEKLRSSRRVGFVGPGGELVGARGADVADEAFEVVFVFGELGTEGVEELGVRRGIADSGRRPRDR